MPTDRPIPPRAVPPAAAPAALAGGILAVLLAALAAPPAAPAQTAAPDGERRGEDGAARAEAAAPVEPPPAWTRDLALFVGLVGFDTGVRGAARELRREGTVNQPAAIAEYFGDWQAVLPAFAAGSALVGSVTEGATGLGKTLAILGGVVAGSMANEGLNQAVGRRRPLEGRGAFSFDPFHGHASFPSGHAAFAFSLAGGVDAATEHWFPAAAAYSLAAGTAASRIHDGKHWASDVVVGAAIGTVVSRWTTRRLMGALGIRHPDPPGATDRGLVRRLRPVAAPGFVGLSVRF